MAKKGLKDLEFRVPLPWKDDPTAAHRMYKQIVNSDNPAFTAREICRKLKGR